MPGVIPNAALVRTLNTEKGWTIERFSLEADMGMRTAQRLFAGQRVSMGTVAAAAKTFAVDYKTLLLDRAGTPQKRQFQVVIHADMEEMNQHPIVLELVTLLQKIAGTTSAFRIVDVRSGSVILTLEMDEADALRLVEVFPNFHEYAREVLAAMPKTTDAEMDAYSKLRRLVEGVTELRVIAEPDPLVTENEVARDEHRPVPSQATVDRMNELRTIICRRMLDTYGVAAFTGGIPGMESSAKLLEELAQLEHQYR